MAEVGIPDQSTVVCKNTRFGENHHFSSVIFTPEVKMEHGDRRWKAYPIGNKGESPEFE